MFPIPKSVFLTHGVGAHRQRLSAFEYALRDADIEQQNLVTVSSILPAALPTYHTGCWDCGAEPWRDNILCYGPGRDE
jgi:pyruvoyl-dependent arginine decarboxylase (PvlArgDC)